LELHRNADTPGLGGDGVSAYGRASRGKVFRKLLWRTKSEYDRLLSVNDIRRGALLITAAILAARRIALCQSKPSPALEFAISDSIIMAEKILKRIDERWPPETLATSPTRPAAN